METFSHLCLGVEERKQDDEEAHDYMSNITGKGQPQYLHPFHLFVCLWYHISKAIAQGRDGFLSSFTVKDHTITKHLSTDFIKNTLDNFAK